MATPKRLEGSGGPADVESTPGDGTSPMSLVPLYAVVFAGFVGYSLMITVFTPMVMGNHDLLLRANEPMHRRVILLGILLCLYPLGQFVGSPVLGSLSDRFGRKPVLLISLFVTTVCYALIGSAIHLGSFALLVVACLIGGVAEANVVAAQSAIADVIPPEQRNRFFGYIYLSASTAYIVGPLVGGRLADQRLVSWFSDATPFWAAMILLAITTAATALFFAKRIRLHAATRSASRKPSAIYEVSFRTAVCAGCTGSISPSISPYSDFSVVIPCIWWTVFISASQEFLSSWRG